MREPATGTAQVNGGALAERPARPARWRLSRTGTRGNFRLIHRLFVQVERIMKINDLSVISSDVVETVWNRLILRQATGRDIQGQDQLAA
jgi:hypothetical protein